MVGNETGSQGKELYKKPESPFLSPFQTILVAILLVVFEMLRYLKS
jgi:hypothetical protein